MNQAPLLSIRWKFLGSTDSANLKLIQIERADLQDGSNAAFQKLERNFDKISAKALKSAEASYKLFYGNSKK